MLDGDVREDLAVLGRDYKPSRYPDALVSGTPRQNYVAADSERSLAAVAALRPAVDEAWRRLRSQAGGSL